MSFSWVRPIGALIILTMLSGLTLAQNTDRKEPVSNARLSANSTNKIRATALVDQILAASSKFSDDWLRLKTQNNIAELLWEYDKGRSRRLFEEVFRRAESLQPKVGQGYSSTASYLVDSLRFEMRKEILQSVSIRDGELAEKLAASIQSSKLTNPDLATRQITIDRELVEHNLAVALNIAETDPLRAARLARDSLNRIISDGFTKLIRSMRTRNPELADQLFLEALTALHHKPTYISNKIRILAPYVFPETKVKPDDYSDNGINPDMVNQFLDFIYQALMRQAPDSQVNENSEFGTASFDYRTLRELLPHFEKQNPKRAAELRAYLDEIVRKINEAGRRDMFDGEGDAWAELFKSNVSDLLGKAEASKDQQERDAFYSNAAFVTAMRDGDFEKALPLIERISDQQKRIYLLSMIMDSATEAAIRIGETERAYRYASEMTDLSTQIRMFQGITSKLIGQKQKERAMEVLNETASRIEMLSEGGRKAEEFLALVKIGAQVSAAKGFEVMRRAVAAINSIEFGAHWSEQTIFLKSKGAEIPQTDRVVPGLEDLDFSASFGVLARVDFNKALALARSIRMKEASMLAQIAVCRGVLTSSSVPR